MTEKLEFCRELVDAHLAAAWMSRCGPSGVPGEWFIPGEFMEVIDGELEVEVYPTFAIVDERGRRSWSPHLRSNPNRVEAWEWRLGVGWDDLEDVEIEALEDLNGCFDDHHVDFMVLGAHKECPPVPDEVVKALALLRAGG